MDVAVTKSRDDIEKTLARFGADAFGYTTTRDGQVAIAFEWSPRPWG